MHFHLIFVDCYVKKLYNNIYNFGKLHINACNVAMKLFREYTSFKIINTNILQFVIIIFDGLHTALRINLARMESIAHIMPEVWLAN